MEDYDTIIRQKNVGSLQVRYKDDDYNNDKSKYNTFIMGLSMMIGAILMIFLILKCSFTIENVLPDLSEGSKVICMFLFIAIFLVLYIICIGGILMKVYKGKDGLYNFLDNVNRLETCDIFYNNEKKAFLLSFRTSSETKFYSKKGIQDFLQIKDEEFEWNQDNFKNITDKTFITIDLTEYPKTICTILQEPSQEKP